MSAESGFVLRELARPEELTACQELQMEIWGEGFSERVPYALLLVTAKIGGILAGAFDAADRLQGFVFGLTGLVEGRPAHWSHMLAVRTEARGHGLGRRLKLFQRELLLARGVQDAYWTFDPLVARNAHLNLNRLGVEIVEYVPDMYGTSTGSSLHGGSETDRLVVRWRLGSERVRRAVEGGAALWQCDAEPIDVARRIVIPCDLDRLLREDPQELSEWRRGTRRAFLEALEQGLRVVGFGRQQAPPGAPGGCHYLLSHISSNSS